MEETIVNFKVAKLAKEKGFDLDCFYAYAKDKELKLCTSSKVTNRPVKYTANLIRVLNNTDCPNSCLAPTQSLLQKWLREVHNIIVTSKPYRDDVSNETDEDIEFQTLWENEILDVKDSYNIFSDYTFYHSYEEALEIALYQALLLL